ncbi:MULTISPECIES: ferredoxin [unclassified Streptomyces]|uniref:ferredoxin n=1 Tax=unclassified Streptomyces TaxID=2593676 RepID=UPI002E2B24BC|nr:ferredoxin [Streptomyces sp. NBC_01429]
MKITVEEDLCCGSGLCVVKADQVFDQRDEDGVVVVLNDNPPEEQYAGVRDAAAVCPTAAIHLTE